MDRSSDFQSGETPRDRIHIRPGGCGDCYAAIPVGVVVQNEDGSITEANDAACEILGTPRESLVGRMLFHADRKALKEDGTVLPDEERPALRALATGRTVSDFIVGVETPGNGARKWLHVNCAPVADTPTGKPSGVITTFWDITDRKLAEEKIRGFLESAPDALVIVSAEGRITLINTQAEKMFGYERDELLGQTVEILVPERFRTAHVGHRHDFVREPRTRPMGVGLYLAGRKKDGSEFPVEISLSPVQTREGLLVIAIIRDITERKRIEEEIKALNEDLKRSTAQLEAANKELESFSYSVSHDLRAPLRSIDGFSLALLEDYADKLDDEGKSYLQRVRNASQKMAQLIDDILKLSRVTRSEMRSEPVDLSSIAQSIAQDLMNSQPERRVEFVIQPGVVVQGDSHLLQVAMQNLLGNAWKFTGGRDVARIEFGTMQVDSRTTCFVRDNGAGFDMAYADKLFGAFQRLHSEAEFPGTGIGLATVKRVMNRHGGEVWAEGEQDKGAVFYFTLPEGEGK